MTDQDDLGDNDQRRTCPKCHGEADLIDVTGGWSPYRQYIPNLKCPHCDGKGWINS